MAAAAAGEARFIGGHPICGSEARGPERASAELFAGATWFLTPSAATEPSRYAALHAFVAALGAQPIAVDPAAHDRLVAITSHLPHALANLLLNHAGATRVEGHEPLAAAGGSLRDMTRVAGANPRIWVDIFLDNREAVAAALAEHRRRVEQLEAALADGDAGFLARWIGEASSNRRRMLSSAYEDPGDLYRLRVHVPDRPGVLAGITQALGAERINIADFDLQHLSSERGGTLTILVAGDGESARAADILEAQGYGVVRAPVLGEWELQHGVARPAREGRARRGDRRPRRRAGGQVDLPPGCAARARRRGRDADRRLRTLRRHGGDARRRARARRHGLRARRRGAGLRRRPARAAGGGASTAPTRARSCGCSRASSPVRRGGPSS